MTWIIKLKDLMLGPAVDKELLLEKRKVPRINCFIEAAFETSDKTSFVGNITVIEISGLRCLTPEKLNKGQQLQVSVSNFSGVLMHRPYNISTVTAEVIWCKHKSGMAGYYAGLKFVEDSKTIADSWVHFVLESFRLPKEAKSAQKRKEIRLQAALPVKCLRQKHKTLEGVASDIGMGGLRIHLKNDLPIGGEVTLQLGPLKRLGVVKCPARVRRSTYNPADDEFVLGLEFTRLDEKDIQKIGKYIMALLKESTV